MVESANTREFLNAVSKILLWSFGLNLVILLGWFLLLLLAGDLVYDWHSRFFQISREQFDAIHYLAMSLTKVAVFGLFLFPYVGIRLVLRER
jgi:hypothetical protein